MIVPMIKYAFLLHHNDLNGFLADLQKLGMVDVERHDAQLDDEAHNLFKQSERYSSAYKQLETVKVGDDDVKPYKGDAEELLNIFESVTAEQEKLTAKAKRLEKEIQEAQPWGVFDNDLLSKIDALGLKPHFYVVYDKVYQPEWEKKYAIQVINKVKGKIYFVLLEHPGDTFDFNQQEIKFPQVSYIELGNELKTVLHQIAENEVIIKQLSFSKNILLKEKNRLLTDFDFRVAGLNAKRKADDSIAIVKGWMPETQNAELVDFLDKNGILYVSEKPQQKDNPPVLLKNNRFARLYEFITRLYSLPNYGELDLTPFLAPFFMLFFGMCFGDGGYGLVLLVAASLLKLKFKDQNYRDILTLVQYLGIATIVVCLFTGSFFGMTIGPFNILGSGGYVEQAFGLAPNFALLILSIIIGVVQVLFAMCLRVAKIIKQSGIRYALSQIGWIVILLCGIVYLLLSLTKTEIGFGMYVIFAFTGAAVLLVFFFNSPGKNPFMNFGLGIWDTYNMASGLLGDLLSYIRLFALGFTGGVLGMVFNSLAFSIDVGFLPLTILASGIVLILGHSLNFALNGLGAFVHPLRLTFVEFYKNAGFEGGGKTFNPFKIND